MDEPKDNQLPEPQSKRWSGTTKLIVGLSIVAVLGLLFVQLRSWIGMFILSFVIAYLFYPLANLVHKRLKLPWGISVGLFYILLVLILLRLLTWGGFAFVQPVTNLVNFVQDAINEVPQFLDNLTKQTLVWGPFQFTFDEKTIDNVTNQILGLIQPIISQAGSLVGSFASGAANLVYRIAFMLLISYFVLAETKGQPDKMIDISIPGYQEDFRRMGVELSRIWNAFLRGQLSLVLIAIIGYSIILNVLGVKYAFGLALLAGLARFVPYVGPWVTWVTYFLVALLQGSTIFGLEPFPYAIMVVIIALVFDTYLDNFVLPKVYSNTLRVHPAAVLVAILVSAAWLGFIGIILAAPVLASVKLLWDYAWQKMWDRDPWANIQTTTDKPVNVPFVSLYNGIVSWIKKTFKRKPKTGQVDKNENLDEKEKTADQNEK
ncbi:MAG: AI-2E family transporter [Chloroflexi bacterium]|nr:AI-2E family transporter [Chloroflexota bacterium]